MCPPEGGAPSCASYYFLSLRSRGAPNPAGRCTSCLPSTVSRDVCPLPRCCHRLALVMPHERSFRPRALAAPRRFAPHVDRRLVASCSRSWGSSRFQLPAPRSRLVSRGSRPSDRADFRRRRPKPWHITAFPVMPLPSEVLPSMSAVPHLRGHSLLAVLPPTLAPLSSCLVHASVPAAPERRPPYGADVRFAFLSGRLVGLRASPFTGRAHRRSLLAQRLTAPGCPGSSSSPTSRSGFGFDFEGLLVHRVRCVLRRCRTPHTLSIPWALPLRSRTAASCRFRRSRLRGLFTRRTSCWSSALVRPNDPHEPQQ